MTESYRIQSHDSSQAQITSTTPKQSSDYTDCKLPEQPPELIGREITQSCFQTA